MIYSKIAGMKTPAIFFLNALHFTAEGQNINK